MVWRNVAGNQVLFQNIGKTDHKGNVEGLENMRINS